MRVERLYAYEVAPAREDQEGMPPGGPLEVIGDVAALIAKATADTSRDRWMEVAFITDPSSPDRRNEVRELLLGVGFGDEDETTAVNDHRKMSVDEHRSL